MPAPLRPAGAPPARPARTAPRVRAAARRPRPLGAPPPRHVGTTHTPHATDDAAADAAAAVVAAVDPTATVGVVSPADDGGDRVAAVEQVAEKATSSPQSPVREEDPRTGWRARWTSPHDAAIVGLAVPALGSLLLDPILSLVDTSLVGRLGTEQLAAVGLSSIAFTFFSILFNFLIFATTPAVAAAASRGDDDEVAAVNARGLWVAAAAGGVSGVALFAAAPALAAAAGAGPTVAAHAVVYLRCRALACPALLAIFVACGAFRGVRDTRTPLAAAAVANAVNLAGDVVLMFGLGLGVAGAALATAASQYVSAALLVRALLRRGLLRPAALLRPPSLASCAPLLKSGAALAARNVATMAVILVGTHHVSSLGAVAAAAHEVLRQLWIASVTVFSALDVACQSLVATYVGGGDPATAREVALRGLQIAVAAGGAVGLALAVAAPALPAAFTADAAVATAAAAVMPVVAAFMPVDAAAAVLEGGLLGASDTAWVARCTVGVSAACVAALLASRAAGAGLVGVWLSFKTLSAGRAACSAVRYVGRGSPLGRGYEKKQAA